jgi:hypothetical protein
MQQFAVPEAHNGARRPIPPPKVPDPRSGIRRTVHDLSVWREPEPEHYVLDLLGRRLEVKRNPDTADKRRWVSLVNRRVIGVPSTSVKDSMTKAMNAVYGIARPNRRAKIQAVVVEPEPDPSNPFLARPATPPPPVAPPPELTLEGGTASDQRARLRITVSGELRGPSVLVVMQHVEAALGQLRKLGVVRCHVVPTGEIEI